MRKKLFIILLLLSLTVLAYDNYPKSFTAGNDEWLIINAPGDTSCTVNRVFKSNMINNVKYRVGWENDVLESNTVMTDMNSINSNIYKPFLFGWLKDSEVETGDYIIDISCSPSGINWSYGFTVIDSETGSLFDNSRFMQSITGFSGLPGIDILVDAFKMFYGSKSYNPTTVFGKVLFGVILFFLDALMFLNGVFVKQWYFWILGVEAFICAYGFSLSGDGHRMIENYIRLNMLFIERSVKIVIESVSFVLTYTVVLLTRIIDTIKPL